MSDGAALWLVEAPGRGLNKEGYATLGEISTAGAAFPGLR